MCEFIKAVSSTPALLSTPTKDGATGARSPSTPGIIVANPCQLLWYRGGSRAVSNYEWLTLPRPSAVHDALRVDAVKNRIPGHHDYEEHVRYIWDKVIPTLVKKDAKIDVIGAEYTGTAVLEYLAANCTYFTFLTARFQTLIEVTGTTYAPRITGIALVTPQHKLTDLVASDAPPSFIDFLAKRTRAYFVHPSPIETPISGREEFGCNCYASGEHSYPENTIVRSWRHILDWFDMLYVNKGFEEIEFVVAEGDGEGAEKVGSGW